MKAIIEMPKGTMDKVELDKDTGTLKVDRKLDVKVPHNYGFLDNTLAEDGDPLDVFVLGPELKGLDALDVIPVGVFLCTDQGIPDHKILALPWDLKDMDTTQAVSEIAKYLTTYKKGFEVIRYSDDVLRTLHVIRKSRLHRVRPIYQHETLGLRRLLGLLIFTGLIILFNHFFGKH